MTKIFRKISGGIDLTWPKLIVSAVIAGVLTAVIALIPALHYTSLHTVTVTFEVWILFGIIIIMNSKSNLDSALKCFVFFLISQPLVYLIQVPFSPLGWQLFGYYPYWLIWTILCLPMGFVGYWMKKDKWWGYLILLPMIILTGSSYLTYFSDFQFSMPRYVLIVLFCACAMILYPNEWFAVSYGEVTSGIEKFGDFSSHPSNAMKHTAYIQVGSSGGAAINEQMKLVGITPGASLSLDGKTFNYGVMIPISEINVCLDEWRKQ